MKTIKAVALDAWGTLFDEKGNSLLMTADKIVKDQRLSMSGEEFLALWSEHYSEHVHSSYNIRKTNIISLREAFGTLGIKRDVEEYVNFLIDTRWANSLVYPEVPKVLDSIKLPMCVVSNIDDDTLRKSLDKNNLSFEYTVTSESAKAFKPHPGIFQEALRLLRCSSEEILFIGDNQQDDIVGARNAGIPVVWLNRNRERLRKGIPEPDYEVEDLTGLLEIIDEP